MIVPIGLSESDDSMGQRAGRRGGGESRPGVDTLSLRLVTRAGIKGDLTILA